MDTALYDYARYDMARYDIHDLQFDQIIASFEDAFNASFNVTRRSLRLSDDRDELTGWWFKSYSETAIQMIIGTRSVASKLASVGSYVKEDAVGLTLDSVHTGDQIVTSDNISYEVKTVIPYEIGDSFLRRDCDLTRLPFATLNTGSQTTTLPSGTPQDARYRTKDWLETYIDNANLTKDDDATQASFIVMYDMKDQPQYPLTRVFKDKAIDLVFAIDDPATEPLLDSEGEPHHYFEKIPITTCCIDKTGITGVKLQWKANQELRTVAKEHPLGSRRELNLISKDTENLGSTILYKSKFMLSYIREPGEG